MNDLPSGQSFDDDSSLQPPPSDMESVTDLEEAAAPPTVHDQLPTPEEYKANLADGGRRATATGGGIFGGSGNKNNPQDGTTAVGKDFLIDDDDDDDENVHDQLPTADEYKAKMMDSPGGHQKKSRAGLFTFVGLVLLTIIATAIAVPIALSKQKEKEAAAAAASQLETNAFDENDNEIPPALAPVMTKRTPSPVRATTYPPASAPATVASSDDDDDNDDTDPLPGSMEDVTQSDKLEKVIDYLVSVGVVEREMFEKVDFSPQAEATYWIANEDGFDIDVPENPELMTRFTERWSLAVLYYAASGHDWRYQLNFLQPVDHCDWYETFIDTTGSIVRMGITECTEGKFANKIEMSNNLLSGSIPSEIQHVPELTDIIIPFNIGLVDNKSFDGLVKLSNLKHLELQYCGLTGWIPSEMGSLTALSFLGLGNNFLDGTVPSSFFDLTNLEVLGLDDNALESPIEPFSKFVKMERLYIEDNLITGQITGTMLEQWTEMIDFDVSANKLEGPLPSNVWSAMPKLEVLDIHGNQFIGAIPDIDAVHDSVTYVAIQNNGFDWRIPETIGNLINLAHLDVSNNNMVTPFPSTMNQLSNLRSLYTGINPFDNHTVPEFLSGMTSLQELSMKQNKLTGTIPTFLGSLTQLKVLDLDFNTLTGTIPGELGALTGIDTLMLNRNFLGGIIPETFSGLKDLDVLLLDGNNLNGNADVICLDTGINTTFFSSDCAEPDPEIVCSCCHLCCNDNNATCNNVDWRVNLDGIWEYDFQRVVYTFSQNLLPYDSKESYVDKGAVVVPETSLESESKNDDDWADDDSF